MYNETRDDKDSCADGQTDLTPDFEREVLSGVPAAIIVTDTAGCIVYWNDAAHELHGWHPDEVLGKDVRELIFSEEGKEATARGVDTALATGSWSGEAEFRRKDGSFFPAFFSIKFLGDKKTGHLIGVIHDFTHRKKLEAQLLQSQKMDALGTLAGGMAHDFNNLLSGILGAATLARSEIDEREDLADLIDTIDSAGRRGKELVSRVLTFSRADESVSEVVDPVAVVRDLVQIIGRTLPKGISIATDLPPSVPRIIGDRSRLVHALLNLCVNARDSMGEKGNLKISVSVEDGIPGDARHVEMETGTQYVRFEVADDGSGMDDSVRSRVLDPFFTTKTKGEGTGLGLPIVVSTAQAHEGRLRIWSKVNEGSTIAMFIPATDRAVESVERPRGTSEQFRGSETVLVVDDESIVRKVARRVLERNGYKVLEAEHGLAAVDVIRSHSDEVGLILLDMVMPVMDGREFFWKLKESHPGIPIVLNSAFSAEGRVGKLLEAGASGFLRKPYELVDLLRTVRLVLDGEKIPNVSG